MSAIGTKQLIDARNDYGIRSIAGVCSNGAQFADYIDSSEDQLMKRGAWFGSQVLMRLCTTSCDVVFPRRVGTVIGLRFCGENYTPIQNNWWSIIGGRCDNFQPNTRAIDTGETVPIFSQVTGTTGKLIRYHVVKAQDIGKTITIYGKQYGAQPLQTEVAGVWQPGVTITAASPIAQTAALVTKIDSVVREATEGMAYLYEYDPATGLLRMLAAYEPNETNPAYRRMRIPHMSCKAHSTDANGVNTWQLEALVLLEHIKIQNDNDFLIVSDMAALKYAIQARKLEEANDYQSAEAFWDKAIRELNFRDRQKSPSDQLSVRVNTMGSNRVLTSPY